MATVSVETRGGVATTIVNNSIYLWTFGLIAALLAPFLLANSYQINILVLVLLFVMLALSLDLLLGFTGYLSLAHHGLWAIGAYTSGLLTVKAGIGVWPAVLAAIVLTGVIGALIAIPAFRVRGHYFALATLAIGELIRIVMNNWVAVTNGPFGLTGIPSLALPVIGTLDARIEYYYVILAFVIAVIFGMVRMLESPFGRCLRTIKEDEDLAEAQGLHLMHYKVTAFGLSASIAGASGALFAHYQHVIGPDNFAIQYMAEILVMIIVGGSGLIAGSILGPLIFIPLPEFLRVLNQLSGGSGFFSALTEGRLLFFGLFLIIIIIKAPDGVAGEIRSKIEKRASPESDDPKESEGESQ